VKKYFIIFVSLITISCNSQTSAKKSNHSLSIKYKFNKADEQWKSELTSLQYYVLRQAGTERAFSGEYDKNYDKGLYVCAACKALYMNQITNMIQDLDGPVLIEV